MAGVDDEFTEPPRRQVAFVCGRWHVTYRSPAEPDGDTEVRSGMLVGPLMLDRYGPTVLAAVSPDGDRPATVIRRDWITSIASPRSRARQRESPR